MKDETLQKYEDFDVFDNYLRPSHTSVPEFVREFNMLSNRLRSTGTALPDDLLAFKLFKAAYLSPDHEKLAKATYELKYKSRKEQLRKIFADTKTTLPTGVTSLKNDEINVTKFYHDTLYDRHLKTPRRCAFPHPRAAGTFPHPLQYPQ